MELKRIYPLLASKIRRHSDTKRRFLKFCSSKAFKNNTYKTANKGGKKGYIVAIEL